MRKIECPALLKGYGEHLYIAKNDPPPILPPILKNYGERPPCDKLQKCALKNVQNSSGLESLTYTWILSGTFLQK